MSDKAKMTFRKWLIGAGAALFLSFLVALAALSAGGNWKVIAAVFGSAAVTHFGAWMQEHPVDQIDDGETPTKT